MILFWTLFGLALGLTLGSSIMAAVFIKKSWWLVSGFVIGLFLFVMLVVHDNMMAQTLLVCDGALGSVVGNLVAGEVIIKKAKS